MKRRYLFLLVCLFTHLPVLAQVDTAWVRRYNGPGNGADVATALAIDDSGNLYVTGHSPGSGTFSDYATIKYSPSGDTLWVRRYNGPPGNSTDEATALAVDASGNVYVTGSSIGSGTASDYATIKYSSAGDELWVRRYNGPGDDYASALAVDGSGNVYVTGFNVVQYCDDYECKYLPEDYHTIKYNSAGDTVWVRRYNGPGNDYDRATAIAVDTGGNVYVTGFNVGLNCYYVCDYYYCYYYCDYLPGDYNTVKYNSAGDTLWVRSYNGPGNGFDRAYALAVDASGNVYVTGESEGSGTSVDYATLKYAPNGDTLWVSRYNGPGNFNDHATALALDNVGNVYVTGHSWGSGTTNDYATLKYAPNGDTLWVRRYNGPGNSHDGAHAVAVDGSGNVYVTGNSPGSGTSDDYATIKYSSAGDTLWVRRYNGPGNGYDYASALAVDGSGNLYVTGNSDGSGTSRDYATIKYSPTAAAKGDMDGDGGLSPADVVLMLNCVFLGSGNCSLSIADVNCSGGLTAADVVWELYAVFLAAAFPC